MKQVVKAWKVRQDDNNPNIVKIMPTAPLILDIEEVKEEVESEERREIIRKHIEREVQEDLEQIKLMNLSKSSILAEIQHFTEKELCTLIRYTN